MNDRVNARYAGSKDAGGFFFMRHGETTANRDGVRSGGDNDVHLTKYGREQAAAGVAAVASLAPKPGLIVTSALSRTRKTAEILNLRLGLEMRVEARLNERLLGEWNGQKNEDTQHLLAAGATPPGGESSARFAARVLAAFETLTPLYGKWPVIVSSCGIARVLMEHAGHYGVERLANGVILCVTLADAEGFEVARIKRLR